VRVPAVGTPPPIDEEILFDETPSFTDTPAAASALRKLAARLETESEGASRITIQVTAWRRRP
jgi:hypothetical protein